MGELWHDAAAFAARVHRHQRRKDDVTPYFAHVARVALIVATSFEVDDEVILAAAFLHDVIEDCDVDYDDLLERFGAEVADLVAVLSKDKRQIEPAREDAYHAQLAAGPWQAKMIKLADVCDNLADAQDPEQAAALASKVRRALSLADGEPRLEKARLAVETHLARHECIRS